MSATATSLDTTLWTTTDAVCRHCGDPCRIGAFSSEHGTFCCSGCESVYVLLAEYGLTAFYAASDTRPGRRQANLEGRDPGRFAALDDPAIAARLVTGRGPELMVVTFPVPTLHCASCVWLLEQLWRFDAGIARSEVNLLTRTVRVEFRPAETSLRAIAERLAALGYEPVLDGERTPGAAPAARRRLYLKLGLAGFAFGNVMLFSIPRYANGAPLDAGFQRLFDVLNITFALPVLLYSASDYLRAAWAAARARIITLDVPIALGLVALFGRSVYDIGSGRGEGFLDSFTGLTFFLLIGRLFQQKVFDGLAFDRSVRSFLPLSVRVVRDDRLEPTRIELLQPGDVMAVRPQEVVPADAVLLDGTGDIDYAFVTGERAPIAVAAGDRIQAGGRVIGRALRLVVNRPVSESRLAMLWGDPVFADPKTPGLATVLARIGWWFTVAAVALAVGGALWWWPDVDTSLDVATAVLIVACPCALSLSAPITLASAMTALGRAGFFLKQPAVALDLSRVSVVTFDKTGTLSAPAAGVTVTRTGLDDEAWALARALASESVHPVSRAIATSPGAPTSRCAATIGDVIDTPGRGIAGTVNGTPVAIGSASWVAERAGRPVPADAGHTWVAVGHEIGRVTLSVADRPGMTAAVRALAARFDTWLLSGDDATEASRWESLFGDRMRFRQSPEDKLGAIRARQLQGDRVLMIGDGLNDAGALAAADVGVAVSDDTACLVPACDAIVRGDALARLPVFLSFLDRARAVVMLCFALSIAYNLVGLAFALSGRLTPLATAILMPASSLTIVAVSVGLMRLSARRMLAA